MPVPIRNPKKTKSTKPVHIKRVKEVVFDEDARKEYLTGFSKRKKARELVARNKAIDREREELNESRREMRDERKERAATNVRNAKALYGDHSDEDSEDEGEDSDASSSRLQAPGAQELLVRTAAYETTELVTTVSIEPFSLSRSSSPANELDLNEDGEVVYPDAGPNSMKSTHATGAGASKKRVKNKPAFRPKMSRSDKKDRATGGKKKKAGFLKGNSGTKGKSNRD